MIINILNNFQNIEIDCKKYLANHEIIILEELKDYLKSNSTSKTIEHLIKCPNSTNNLTTINYNQEEKILYIYKESPSLDEDISQLFVKEHYNKTSEMLIIIDNQVKKDELINILKLIDSAYNKYGSILEDLLIEDTMKLISEYYLDDIDEIVQKKKEKEKYNYNVIKEIIDEEDIDNLLNLGAPSNEYKPEIDIIAQKVRPAMKRKNIFKIIKNTFVENLGTNVSYEVYYRITDKLLERLKR